MVAAAGIAALLGLSELASAKLVRANDIPLRFSGQDIAAADFNGDGVRDLAVTGADAVTILKGHGDGTFKQAGQFATGRKPEEFAVADLNGDGTKDLVVPNFDSNNVSVLVGRGNGTFMRRVNYRTGDGPSYVDVGRLGRDRHPDLAITNLWDDDVSIVRGRGDGTFHRKRDHRAGYEPSSVAIANLNGDRRRDLVVADDDRVAFLKGTRRGRFKRGEDLVLRASLYEVIAADFDRDGVTDLAVSNPSRFGVYIASGRGQGGFEVPPPYGFAGPSTKIAAADLVGGPSKDLVVEADDYPLDFEDDPAHLYVLRGHRDGSFSDDIDVELDGDAGRFAIADLDGDGSRDVAAITYAASPKIEVFLNR